MSNQMSTYVVYRDSVGYVQNLFSLILLIALFADALFAWWFIKVTIAFHVLAYQFEI